MITKFKLQNFRGFKDHELPLASMAVLVGQNNSGKTTIVEALRLLSMVTLRFQNIAFRAPPNDSYLSRRLVGVSPSLKNVEINFKTIFNNYGEPPGILEANFSCGTSITIYVLRENRIHAVIKDKKGNIIGNKQQAAHINLPSVHIMPLVAPLQREETILSDEYIRAKMSSRLTPLHFRNQLRVKYKLFPEFKKIVEDSWPGVQISELIGFSGLPGEDLHLQIRDEDFVAEVAEMGHGLQIWLQTMWFLTLAGNAPTVILDEPDVYMHADLQRRIIRILRNRHEQIIVTTHSVEIMSEVQPDEILIIDRRRSESSFAGAVPVVQAAIDQCGSVHNLHLVRLLSTNRMILVEGRDLKILKEFQDTLFPQSCNPFQELPNMPIGGWGGWKLAVGNALGFHNALGQRIKVYCILDSDYHYQDEIKDRYIEAQQNDIHLHVWSQKEIENYLLVPTAISRFIATKIVNERVTPPSTYEVSRKLSSLADGLEETIQDAIAAEFWNSHRDLGHAGANKAARQRIRTIRDNHGNIISLASGKQLLKDLSSWSKTIYGVSLSAISIARLMKPKEIDSEMVDVISAIEKGNPFMEFRNRYAF